MKTKIILVQILSGLIISAPHANAQIPSDVNKGTNAASNPELKPPLNSGLHELYKGSKTHVSWIRNNLYSINASGAKTSDEIDWLGSGETYTIAYTNTIAGKNKPAKDNVQVYGRKNDVYWSTAEKGIIDLDNIPTNLAVQIARSSYAIGELTNILSFGLGIHWDVNSIKYGSDGKIHGKSKDSHDDLEGTVEFLPDGKMADCFYEVPEYKRQYLLSYLYDDSGNEILSGLTNIVLSIIVPSLSPQYKYLKAQDLLSYTILHASIISPDDTNLMLLGIPSSDLYQYAMISNGLTVPTKKLLSSAMLLDSQPKTMQIKPATGLTKNQLLAAGFILANIIIMALVLRLLRKSR